MDSTTEEFTALATPIEPPLVLKPFLAGDDADDRPVDHRFDHRELHVVGGGERREGGHEAARRTVLEVDVEQIARQEAGEAHQAGQRD